MALPRFFAPGAPGDGRIVLDIDEAHHLTRVLRLGAGADVRVFDGAGREWLARVETAAPRQVVLRLAGAVAPAAEPPVRVTLGIGLLKGDQMDAVVRDATALGVVAIAPVLGDRVAVPRAAWRTGAAARWQRVAVAACKQSGRAVVPEIRPPAALGDVIAAASASVIVMAIEPEARGRAVGDPQTAGVARSRAAVAGGPLPADWTGSGSPPASALLLIGPEGGWSEVERELAAGRGASALFLGPRTLRAETAPVVALSALWARWGW